MRKRAFTLVELMVVITILILLVMILVPSMNSAKESARASKCATNLHHIGEAFAASNLNSMNQSFSATVGSSSAKPIGNKVTNPFPMASQWPAVPMDTISTHDMYLCETATFSSTSNGTSSGGSGGSGGQGGSYNPGGPTYYCYTYADDKLIPFAAGDYCHVTDCGDYYKYVFDAGTGTSAAYKAGGGAAGVFDWDDLVFHVSKTTPPVATFMPDANMGRFNGIGVMSLRTDATTTVSGWDDFSHVDPGTAVILDNVGTTIPAGSSQAAIDAAKAKSLTSYSTSYGINAKSENITFGTRKVLVLDYITTIANNGEDLGDFLSQSARHLGKMNVLFADQTVVRMAPTELAPAGVADSGLWNP